MGCFDTTTDDGKPLDLDAALAAKGAGGVPDWRNTYRSLFRARGFYDTSLQAHAELPDPLWPKRMAPNKRIPFALRAGREL
jgi:hypothetical protein